MPCCCATDLKAAYVLGIVLAGVNLVPALTLHPPFIAIGILGALVHAVLAFGAFKSHSTAILIWMGLACLSCLGIAIVVVYVMVYRLWHSLLWSFQGRDTKLERFLAKNQLYSNEITKF